MMQLPLTVSAKAFRLTAISLALVLSACGGDQTVDSIAPEPDLGKSDGQTDGGTLEGGGQEEVAALNISDVTLLDSNGNPTRVVTSLGATAKVTVTDAGGEGISGALVTFSGEGVEFGTSNGAVLTDTQGVASISVMPLDKTDSGSYQMSATALYDDKSKSSGAYFISIQPATTTITKLAVGQSTLRSGDSTNVTLVTTDVSGHNIQNNIAVHFSASCGTFSDDTVTSTNQGNVTTTYKSIDEKGNLCEGRQTIFAKPVNNSAASVATTVLIDKVQANSLVYTADKSIQLGAVNSGSSSSDDIEFTVYSNGTPASNQEVVVSKVFAPEDFSFGKLGNKGSLVVKSDSQGRVMVPVYPGSLPGPVELKAALKDNTRIFALSKNVSVATGRPTQNGMSLSLNKNVLQAGVDGDSATITVRLVDRLGNAVPDGTVVSFVSEGGQVTPSCATNNGRCSAVFTTQNPRPLDDRISIIAYVEGDKSYIDTDRDNNFTFGSDRLINNIGSFFRDDNENNQYDPSLGEFVYRRDMADGGSSAKCGLSTFAHPNIAQTCDNGLAAILRYQTVVGLANDTPVIEGLSDAIPANSATNPNAIIKRSFRVFGNSARTVSMPSGTTISMSAVDKTNYTPTAVLVDGNIQVSSAEPNSIAIIKAGSASYYVNIGADGTGTKAVDLPADSALSVANTNINCEVEIVQGYETVPKIVDLGISAVKDSVVRYQYSYSGCRPGDQIKVSVTSPAPFATTSTKTIYIR